MPVSDEDQQHRPRRQHPATEKAHRPETKKLAEQACERQERQAEYAGARAQKLQNCRGGAHGLASLHLSFVRARPQLWRKWNPTEKRAGDSLKRLARLLNSHFRACHFRLNNLAARNPANSKTQAATTTIYEPQRTAATGPMPRSRADASKICSRKKCKCAILALVLLRNVFR